jgi:hypothetical protein
VRSQAELGNEGQVWRGRFDKTSGTPSQGKGRFAMLPELTPAIVRAIGKIQELEQKD